LEKCNKVPSICTVPKYAQIALSNNRGCSFPENANTLNRKVQLGFYMCSTLGTVSRLGLGLVLGYVRIMYELDELWSQILPILARIDFFLKKIIVHTAKHFSIYWK
jgi:hypothetical protein